MYDREYYEGEASNYGAFGGYGGRLFGISRFLVRRKAFSIIRRHKKGGRMVELGCAYGFLADSARRRGFQAMGVDISSYAICQARKRFPGTRFETMDIQGEVSLKPGSFDVVTAMDVLEHCSDLGRALSNISTIMKDDGILLASVPDTELFPPERDRDGTHVWMMSMESWLRAFSESGFSVAGRWVFPRGLRRILPHWCVSLVLLRKKASGKRTRSWSGRAG